MEEAMNETYAPSVEVEVPDTKPQTAAEERLAAPLEKRTVAMIVAALIVLPFVLYAGTAFFIPLFVSIFMSYALSPVVDWTEKCRVPRAIRRCTHDGARHLAARGRRAAGVERHGGRAGRASAGGAEAAFRSDRLAARRQGQCVEAGAEDR
jgi:hypothetical protein